jgi:hypothetical protein
MRDVLEGMEELSLRSATPPDDPSVQVKSATVIPFRKNSPRPALIRGFAAKAAPTRVE